jgi:hypothetical protein
MIKTQDAIFGHIPGGCAMQADLHGLRQMNRLSSFRLKDLFATTETI